jgi:DnaD/phage-associated family protein
LWLWALDNAQDGDLSGFSPDEIAEVMEWTGKDPQKLINALIESGFLDDSMNIHNWHEYAGRLIEKRKTDAERKRTSRRKSDSCPQDVRETSDVLPRDGAGNRTLPYLTNSSRSSYNACARENEGPEAEKIDPKKEALSQTMTYFMDNINHSPSSVCTQQIIEYTDIFGADMIIEAMRIAQDDNKRQWSYVHGILRQWEANGIHTIADVERERAEHMQKAAPQQRDAGREGANGAGGNYKGIGKTDEQAALEQRFKLDY